MLPDPDVQTAAVSSPRAPGADASGALARALDRIRPEVRGEQPYVVGGMAAPEVKLNQNESPFDLPPDLKRALFDGFMDVPFNRYASEQPFRLRAALAERHGVAPEAVIVGNGSNELTYTLGMCLIAPGTPVVLPRPMFALYEKVVHLFGGRLVSVGPRAGLGFDVDGLEAAIRAERPAYAVVTTPNNPTGLALRADSVRRLADAFADNAAAGQGGLLVVDEAYGEFVPDTPSALGLLPTHPHVVVLKTFSKAYGLASLRVGYLVGHPAVMGELMKARLPFMVDPLAEHVALWLVKHGAERVAPVSADLAVRTQRLRHDVLARGVDAAETAANFFLFRLPDYDGPTLQDALARHGVAVRSVAAYPDLPGYVRVSCGTEGENRRFLAALDALVARRP